jgi:Protein of unknown function (DUF2510)
MDMESVQAGWYQNRTTHQQKYWDGSQWVADMSPEPHPDSHLSHTAIVAFVLSFIFPLVGWILGLRASREIRESNGAKSGSAFSVAATWIGGIGTVISAAVLALILAVGFSGNDHHMWGEGRGFGMGNHRMMGGWDDQYGGSNSNSGNGGFGNNDLNGNPLDPFNSPNNNSGSGTTPR